MDMTSYEHWRVSISQRLFKEAHLKHVTDTPRACDLAISAPNKGRAGLIAIATDVAAGRVLARKVIGS